MNSSTFSKTAEGALIEVLERSLTDDFFNCEVERTRFIFTKRFIVREVWRGRSLKLSVSRDEFLLITGIDKCSLQGWRGIYVFIAGWSSSTQAWEILVECFSDDGKAPTR